MIISASSRASWIVLLAHMAVVAAGAVVALLSERVVVTYWAMVASTVAYTGCCSLGVKSQERCEAAVPGGVVACTRPARMLMLHLWTQVLMSGL